MSIYGKVAEAKGSRVNANTIKGLGEFYARIEETKVVQSAEKGKFAIVESTVLQVMDGQYTEGDFVCHMQQSYANFAIMEQMIASYVAKFNNVEVGHKFSEVVTENEAKWDELCIPVFGQPVFNPETQVVDWPNDNIMKGIVVHYKVVKDFKKDKLTKKPVLDVNGDQMWYPKVLVLDILDVNTQLDNEVLAKYKDTIHPGHFS